MMNEGSDTPTPPALEKIAHIGVAVANLEDALAVWKDQLGVEVEAVKKLTDRGLHIAFLPVGESYVELIAPLHSDSEVSKFLDKRGPGVHHICFGVADIETSLRRYREKGIRVVQDEPQLGAEGFPVAFLHPKSTLGVLVELLEERH